MGDNSSSNSSSSNSNTSSNEEENYVPRPAFNRNKAPGRSALKGSRGAAGGEGAAAARPGRRVTHRPRLGIKEFRYRNEPGRVANAGVQVAAAAQGPVPQFVDWAGISAREQALLAAGRPAREVGSMERLLTKKTLREAEARGGEVTVPSQLVTSAYVGSHRLGREDPGWPAYELSAADPRADLYWRGERARRYEESVANLQRGVNVPTKLRYGSERRGRNLSSVKALWGYPETNAALAKSLEAKHAPYTENAVARAAALRAELNKNSGASGGASGGSGGRRTRKRQTRKRRHYPKK
jgi:hypothetical protein